MPPRLIELERAAGWPTLRPEDFCHICGALNMTWYVYREIWLVATKAWAAETGREGICCPQCFAALYEQATGDSVIWELRIGWSKNASSPNSEARNG